MNRLLRVICAIFGHSPFCGREPGHEGDCTCTRCGEPLAYRSC